VSGAGSSTNRHSTLPPVPARRPCSRAGATAVVLKTRASSASSRGNPAGRGRGRARSDRRFGGRPSSARCRAARRAASRSASAAGRSRAVESPARVVAPQRRSRRVCRLRATSGANRLSRTGRGPPPTGHEVPGARVLIGSAPAPAPTARPLHRLG
jgi:hypothetical protein